MPGATGDGRTWPFPHREIWPPLQWFNAASTLLVRQLGAGGGRGIRGLHWDAAGEMQEKSRRKAGEKQLSAGIRDGENPPASACPSASSATAGLPSHRLLLTPPPLSARPRRSYFGKLIEITQ